MTRPASGRCLLCAFAGAGRVHDSVRTRAGRVPPQHLPVCARLVRGNGAESRHGGGSESALSACEGREVFKYVARLCCMFSFPAKYMCSL